MNEALETKRNSAILDATLREIAKVEEELASYKVLEQKKKDLLEELRTSMEEYGIDKWETPNGTKITLVKAVEPSEYTVSQFDEASFKLDDPDTYELYCRNVVKKDRGRKGYVRITTPKSHE